MTSLEALEAASAEQGAAVAALKKAKGDAAEIEAIVAAGTAGKCRP